MFLRLECDIIKLILINFFMANTEKNFKRSVIFKEDVKKIPARKFPSVKTSQGDMRADELKKEIAEFAQGGKSQGVVEKWLKDLGVPRDRGEKILDILFEAD